MPLLKAASVLLCLSGTMAAPAPSGGPENNNPSVDIKVKFKPPTGPRYFEADNYTVKKYTKQAVQELLTSANGITTDMYYEDKLKWDHASIEGDYHVAYIRVQFKNGEDDKARTFYDAVMKFDETEDSGGTYLDVVKDYIKNKLDPLHEQASSCDASTYDARADGEIVCTGYPSCMQIDTSSCTDAGDCSTCTDETYGDGYNCLAMELTEPACLYLYSNYADADSCRADYGFWKSTTPMSCTGGSGYEDVAYSCLNYVDITNCWGETTDCSYCTDYEYYTSSNPRASCVFHPEDTTAGDCIFGFCQNNNCYVEYLNVALNNIDDGSITVGDVFCFVFMGAAVITLLLTQVFKPPSLSTELGEHLSDSHH